MADLDALRSRLADLVDEMEELNTPPADLDEAARADWDLDDEAQAEFERLDAEATALRARLDRYEARRQAIEASSEAARLGGDDAQTNRGGFDPPYQNRLGDPWALDTIRYGDSITNLRARINTGLDHDHVTPDTAKTAALRTLERVAGGEPARRTVAMLYLATGSELYRSAFAKLMSGQAWAVTDPERDVAIRAQSLTNAEGGFAVPFTLDPTVIFTNDSVINPIRRIARVVQTTTDSWNGVTGGAAAASYDAEATEVSDDAITLAQPSIPVHKMQVFVPFSIEIGSDWADIDGELRAAMLEGRDVENARAHVTGTGTNEPTGIQTALDGSASELSPATAEVFAIADVYTVQNSLPPRHRLMNPTWVFNIGTANDIRQFDTQGGAGLWTTLAPGAPQTLLGWPWEEASEVDDSPDINPAATEDNFILYAGNWSRYVIVDRVGMSMELIPHLFGNNNRPTGQRGIYGWMRDGADSVDDNAFRVMNVNTTL